MRVLYFVYFFVVVFALLCLVPFRPPLPVLWVNTFYPDTDQEAGGQLCPNGTLCR